jgi:hypothetical protein
MMLAFKNRLRPVPFIVIGVLTRALGHSTDVQGCHGGRGGMGGGYSGGYSGGGYSNGSGSPYYSNPQPAQTSSPNTSLNNPATVLAHEDDLKLTSKQVQALEKMATSGKQHAALVLTSAQRKQLAGIVGIVRKSGSAGTSTSSNFGASSIVQSP